MRSFRELKVWCKAHALTLQVYQATSAFPKTEIYGLTSQMRRAAASIGANIAEGCGKESNLEFTRFLQVAAGSASELEYHLLLARDLEFIDIDVCGGLTDQVVEVKKMLVALTAAVARKARTTKT